MRRAVGGFLLLLGVSLMLLSTALIARCFRGGLPATSGVVQAPPLGPVMGGSYSPALPGSVVEDAYLLYLAGGDRVFVYYRFRGSVHWAVNVTVKRVSDGSSWSYADEGVSREPECPVFIAPSRGVYLLRVRVGFKEAGSGAGYRVNVGVRASSRVDGLPGYLLVYGVGVVLALLGLGLRVLSGGAGSVPRLIEMLSWEAKGCWRHVVLLAVLWVLAYAYAGFGPVWEPVSLRAVAYGGPAFYGCSLEQGYALVVDRAVASPSYRVFEVLHVYAVVIAVMVFTYEVERGVFRDSLASGAGRLELYLVKLATCLLLAYAPLALVHVVLMLLADPGLWASMPYVMLWGLARRLVRDLVFVLVLLGLVLPACLLASKTTYALACSLLAPYALEMIGGAGVSRYLPHSILYGLHEPPYSPSMIPAYSEPLLAVFTATAILGLVVAALRDYA